MKAILVINVPEDDIGKEASVMYLGNDRWLRSIEFIPIKPMPNKIDPKNEMDFTIYDTRYREGWNDCLKEIEK